MLRRSPRELKVVERRLSPACDRQWKSCLSPCLLVANKNTLETFFRLSRHVLKAFAFSGGFYPPGLWDRHPLPMCGAEILGFLPVLLETLFTCVGPCMTYFSCTKGNVCAVSSFWLGMLLDIIPAKCGTSLFTL